MKQAIALLAGITGLALSVSSPGQDCQPRPAQPFRNPELPGRDLFIPYVQRPGLGSPDELRNVQQIKILAEMNELTVELVKRRSNRAFVNADTPKLIKKLKQLAKELQELN